MSDIKQTTVDKFGDSLRLVLKNYNMEVIEEVKMATKEFGKEGVKFLKQVSREKIGKHSKSKTYYTQWTHTIEKETQTGVEITFHSRKYQLPHLLEYPHSVGKYGGGQFGGKPHIEPAEKELEEKYISFLEKRL